MNTLTSALRMTCGLLTLGCVIMPISAQAGQVSAQAAQSQSGAAMIFDSGFEQSFSVGGTVTGLSALNATVDLSLNGGSLLSVNGDGSFAFVITLEPGQSYSVEIARADGIAGCTLSNASGSVGNMPISDVLLDCQRNVSTLYEIKLGDATGTVAVDNLLVTHCETSLGFYAQTIPGDPDFIGSDFSAVFLFNPSEDCSNNARGDRINLVTASVTPFFEEIQLSDATVEFVSAGNTQPDAVIATAGELDSPMISPLNAVLVSVQDPTVTDIMIAGSNDFEIDSRLAVNDRFYTASPYPTNGSSYLSITGVLSHTLDNNRLRPRDASDLLSEPELVINEVDYEQPGVDDGEFIELFNPGGMPFALANVSLFFVSGDDNAVVFSVDLSSLGSLQAGQYLVVGDSTAITNLPPGTPSLLLPGGLQNGPDGIAVANVVSELVIDVLSYEGAITMAELGFALPVNLVEGSVLTAVDNGDGSLSRLPNGRDTNQANQDWAHVMTVTAGQANQPDPVPLEMVINEVDYDQPGTDSIEFIEIRNNSDQPASLSGLAVILVNGVNDTAEYDRFMLSDAGAMLPAGDYLVIASDAVIMPPSTLRISLGTGLVQNGPDGIALVDLSDFAVLDALSYEGEITAATLVGFPTSVNLVEGTAMTAIDNGDGSVARDSNGTDSNDANTDWTFTTMLTPGSDNQ